MVYIIGWFNQMKWYLNSNLKYYLNSISVSSFQSKRKLTTYNDSIDNINDIITYVVPNIFRNKIL